MNKFMHIACVAAGSILLGAGESQAVTIIPVINGDFEAQTGDIGDPTGWSGVGSYRVYNDTGSRVPGSRYVKVRTIGDGDLLQKGAISFTENTLQLDGYFAGDGSDIAKVTLSLLDASDAEVFSVTDSTSSSAWPAFQLVINDVHTTHATATQWQIRLDYDNVTSSYAASKFDDITLTAVPEPSAMALLGLGAVAFILRRRK